MPAPNRFSVLVSAALAVATPLLAGSMAWRLVDEEPRSGPAYVLLYFGGYLLLCQLARTLWQRMR